MSMRRRPARALETQPDSAAGTSSIWPGLLVVSLLIPWIVPFGGLSLSPYRIVLLIMTVPSLVLWVSGRAGRIRLADVLVLMFCAWGAISFTVVHGVGAAVEPAGMQFVETGGAYFLARSFIRSRHDFKLACKVLFYAIAALLPFALVQSVTGINVLLQTFGSIMPVIHDYGTGQRMGLWRVQGPLDHPILFGVFTGSILALTHMVLGRSQPPVRRWMMSAVVVMTVATSLSAGPIAAVLAQVLLMGWDAVFRKFSGRWLLLWAIGLSFYLAIETLSNQSVMAFYVTNFTFDVQSAWQRILLMEYGWTSVFNHPVFGVGSNDWDHPSWMYPSVDMFWLVPFLRHGLPGGALIMLAFFAATFAVGLRRYADEELIACKTAYLIVMVAFFMVAWSVHFWNATYVLFMFMLGSGMWLVDTEPVLQVRQRRQTRRRRAVV